MRLPKDPAKLAALLRRIEKHARELADAQDRVVFEQRSEPVQDAVKEAVSSLYFYPSDSNANLVLRSIVRRLAPEVSAVLDGDGDSIAYRVLNPEPEDE